MNQLATQGERPLAVPGSFNNPVPNTPGELAKVPIGEPLKTLEEVVLFARALAFAGLLPDSLMDRRTQTVKVADVVLLLCMGAELSLSPMQSIHGIYVVKGRPMLSAQLWATRIRQFGHRLHVTMENMPSGKVLSATATIVRRDDPNPQSLTFSIWDAKNAGLVQAVADDGTVRAGINGNATPWQQYTATMLRNRAISHLARFACPEVVFGSMGIKGEEYDEMEEEEGFGDDRFLAGKAIEGTPSEQESLADELSALAARMGTGTGPRPISEALEPLKAAMAEQAAATTPPAAGRPVATVTDPGRAVPRTGQQEEAWEKHVEQVNQAFDTAEGTCDICGRRMPKYAHTEENFDHEPAWVDEPESF
jgi:hypothetical protein